MIIAPSILSADFANLAADVKAVVKALIPLSNLFFDCHLMVEDPEKYLQDFAAAGADLVGVHIEATKHAHRVISKIHQLGMKAEIVLNPGTSLEFAEVDGGINDQTIKTAKAAGATIAVAGSYVFSQNTPEEQIKKLIEASKQVEK